ncbi:hypothetical protein [Paenibacillus sp. HJGM_3]|uniref:hypothetical protein n=1 Tax=Paenibacillus sp. HJGM_3 TaxID=3379816 RepID=UPI00385E12CE
MSDDVRNGRCPKCGSQLNSDLNGKSGVCAACSTNLTSSAAALKDTLVYWEDSSKAGSHVLRHVIVLGAIGLVALVAYFMGG